MGNFTALLMNVSTSSSSLNGKGHLKLTHPNPFHWHLKKINLTMNMSSYRWRL